MNLDKFKGKTPVDVLKEISDSIMTDESDDQMMTYIMNHILGVNCRIVCGIVYLNSAGARFSIQQVAKSALNELTKKGIIAEGGKA